MQKVADIDKFSVGEASKVLRVTVRTLHRWDKSGKLKAHRRIGSNHRYYTRNQLWDFMNEAGKIKYGRT